METARYIYEDGAGALCDGLRDPETTVLCGAAEFADWVCQYPFTTICFELRQSSHGLEGSRAVGRYHVVAPY